MKGIECNNLGFAWSESNQVFNDLSFVVNEGEFVSFIGPSGCGKSTLLSLISGLNRNYSGSVLKDGHEIIEPNKDLGFVFQDASLFPWLSVKDNVSFGLNLNKGQKDKELVDNILNKIGLYNDKNKMPHELSGGMKQRAAIGRVIANGASYLLMDEPFGALDYQTRLNMQLFLSDICKEFNKTVLFVTHHVEEAIILSNKVMLMNYKHKGELKFLNINLEIPGDTTTTQFNEYRKQIITHLNTQVNN